MKRFPFIQKLHEHLVSGIQPVTIAALLLTISFGAKAVSQQHNDDRVTRVSELDVDPATHYREQKKKINQLIEDQRYATAMEKAYSLNFSLQETDFHQSAFEFQSKISDLVGDQFRSMKKQANQFVDQGDPNQAYRHVRKKGKYFRGTEPYRNNVEQILVWLRGEIVQADQEGRLNEPPAFLEYPRWPELAGEDQDKDRYRSQGKHSPRIYAAGPSMSGHPESPKSFKGTVVNTTENRAHFRVDFQGADDREKMGYFLFQLRGLAGRQRIRIDFENMGRWSNSKHIVPLFSAGVQDLSNPASFRNAPPDGHLEYTRTEQGERIPKTRGFKSGITFET